MKRMLFTLFLLMNVAATMALAAEPEPAIYTIQKGDTLWGLSERFLKDPYYWPNLWSKNKEITNPHFIYPGQKIKVYADRIEIVPAQPAVPLSPKEEELVQSSRSFTIYGNEGFLVEDGLSSVGRIIATNHDRVIVGEGDVVYTDMGRSHGVKAGDAFTVFREMDVVTHPVSSMVLGHKVATLGAIRIVDVEEKTSRAVVTKSWQEISVGSELLPYREMRREVALKAPKKDMLGYIVESRTGNMTAGEGDVVYVDLGRRDGVEEGNLLYVVRDVTIAAEYGERKPDKLPVEVLGAIVIVEASEKTSSAIIVKSVKTVYRGDRVEVKVAK